MRSSRYLFLVILSAVLLLGATAACSGGDDDDGSSDGDGTASSSNDGGEVGDDVYGQDGDSDGGGDGVTLGQPTLTADPGQTWVEVDGKRLVYEASGSIHYNCDIGDDLIQVNYQTGEGLDLLIQGSRQGEDWFINMTFTPGEAEIVQYGAGLPGANGTFTVGDSALSYEGIIDRVEDYDILNAEEVDARVAVNCASAGGDPTATIDGQTYVFPASGAQSFDCTIASDDIDVMVNRLVRDDLQLEIDVSMTAPDSWLGHATVYSGDNRFTSTFPMDGEGLTIEGSTLTYDGVFAATDGGEFTGTVDVTCP